MMRYKSESEIFAKAANLKVSLVNRAAIIRDKYERLSKYDAGLPTDLTEVTANTIRDTIAHLQRKQQAEGMQFAVIRWVLSITPDIDPDDLELDT